MPGRILYSCVVDNTPKLLWEGLLFRRAITEIAGVAPDDVVMHFTDTVPEAAVAEVAGPCRSACVARFDTRFGFANKVVQLAQPWPGVDAVAFLDADMVVLAPLDEADIADTVAGVPAFAAVSDEATLRALYRRFGPERTGDWLRLIGLHREPFVTHRNNLNGGLYLVPAGLIAAFGAAWAAEATRFLADRTALEGASAHTADQLGAGTALARLGLRAHHLAATRNCPATMARRFPARIIHDLQKFAADEHDADGHLHNTPEIAAHPERQALAALVEAVNEAPVGRPFHAYRAFRFALQAHSFDLAERRMSEVESGPFPRFAAEMRMHLAAYQRKVALHRA